MLEVIEIIINLSTKNILNCPKNFKIKWVFMLMNKVYLKHGAEDIQGNRLNIRLEYILVAMGQTHSVISNGYHDIHVNNKYIKFKPRSN